MKIIGKWLRSNRFFDLLCHAFLIGSTFLGFYFTVLNMRHSFSRDCREVIRQQDHEIGLLRRQIILLQGRTTGLVARVDEYETILHAFGHSQKITSYGNERR